MWSIATTTYPREARSINRPEAIQRGVPRAGDQITTGSSPPSATGASTETGRTVADIAGAAAGVRSQSAALEAICAAAATELAGM